MLLSFALRVLSRKKLSDSGEQKPSKEINIKNIFNQIKKTIYI